MGSTSDSDRTLFCGLLDLTETLKISADVLMSAGCIRLEAGQEAWAFNGRAIPATIRDPIWQRGITEYRDILKSIVRTREFDICDLTQVALDLPRHVERSGTRGLTRNGTLNRLMRRVQTRDFGWDDSAAEEIDDWMASQMTFVTVRPLDASPLRNSGAATLSRGVRIHGHSQFRANAGLATVPAASRDIGNLAVPPLLRDHPEAFLPFALVPTRASEPGLSVLELSNVDNHTAVTPDDPLTPTVPAALSEQEHVLPEEF